MKFNDWANEERRRLSAFEEYWKARNKENSASFPLDMEPGEWDEQFQMFEVEED